MSIEIISTLKPKNNGTFPIVEAKDIDVNGKRLDEQLAETNEALGSYIDDVDALLGDGTGSGGGNGSGGSVKSITFTDRPTAWEWLRNNYRKAIKAFFVAPGANLNSVFNLIGASVSTDESIGVFAVQLNGASYLPKADGSSELTGMEIAINNESIMVNIAIAILQTDQPVSNQNTSETVPDEYWALVGAQLTCYYIDEQGGGGSAGNGGDAIIDVVELPTENINTQALYRKITGDFYFDKLPQGATIYAVDGLPETGEPCTFDGQSFNVLYYNIQDKALHGYVPATIGAVLGVPAAWYEASMLAGALGLPYGGVVTSFEDMEEGVFYTYIEYALYSYKEKWEAVKGLGWNGDAKGAEVFNSLSNVASGNYSHAEGANTTASNSQAHAEGNSTTASGVYSHAEGVYTMASGVSSHAEGMRTTASGQYSHAEGLYTIASGNNQHVQGRYNIEDADNKYAHIVGNGEINNPSNAHTVDWDGNAWFAGKIKVGGTGYDDPNATELGAGGSSVPLTLLNEGGTVDNLNVTVERLHNALVTYSENGNAFAFCDGEEVCALLSVNQSTPLVAYFSKGTTNQIIEVTASSSGISASYVDIGGGGAFTIATASVDIFEGKEYTGTLEVVKGDLANVLENPASLVIIVLNMATCTYDSLKLSDGSYSVIYKGKIDMNGTEVAFAIEVYTDGTYKSYLVGGAASVNPNLKLDSKSTYRIGTYKQTDTTLTFDVTGSSTSEIGIPYTYVCFGGKYVFPFNDTVKIYRDAEIDLSRIMTGYSIGEFTVTLNSATGYVNKIAEMIGTSIEVGYMVK